MTAKGEGEIHMAAQGNQVKNIIKIFAETLGDYEHIETDILHRELEVKNTQGRTPLHLAAQAGSVEACELLIQ